MGGLASSPGFGYRLVQEMKNALMEPPKSSFWCHMDKHRFYNLVNENMHIVDIGIPTMNICWTGCSILGASKGIEKHMIFVQDSNSILKSRITEKQNAKSSEKNSQTAIRRASLLSDAAGRKEFDINSITSDSVNDVYQSWEEKLASIEKTIENMTTSPIQKKSSIGGMHAILAASKWRRSIKQAHND